MKFIFDFSSKDVRLYRNRQARIKKPDAFKARLTLFIKKSEKLHFAISKNVEIQYILDCLERAVSSLP